MNPRNRSDENRSDKYIRHETHSSHKAFPDEDVDLKLERFCLSERDENEWEERYPLPPREEGPEHDWHETPSLREAEGGHHLPPPHRGSDLWTHLYRFGIPALAGLLIVQLSKGKVEESAKVTPLTPTPTPEEVRKPTQERVTPPTAPAAPEQKLQLRRAPNLAFDDLPQAKKLIPDNVTALTFDDGPDAQYTRSVLDILDKHNAKATFFVTGASVKRHPEILREIVKRGHEVGIHSMTHARLGTLSDEQVRWEIRETKRAIDAALGKEYRSNWMRAPYGSINKGKGVSEYGSSGSRVLAIANEEGLAIAHWTSDTNDWRRSTASQSIAQSIARGNGEVVLLHDAVDARLRMTQFGENELLLKHGKNPPIHADVVPDRETMLKGLEEGLAQLSTRRVASKTLSDIYVR